MWEVPQAKVRFETVVQPGANWSHVLKRGTTLRIIDMDGGANVSAMFYNFELPVERYNMPDTLKGQHTAYLTKGNVLYSDMGRVLVSMTEDACGWHDTVCGFSTAEMVREQFGEADYQSCHNDFYRNARDNFVMELEKYGLGLRDFTAPVNFFSKVTPDNAGNLIFHEEHSHPTDFIDLRAEMNTLVVLNTCVHPLTTVKDYPRKTVRLIIYEADPVSDDDVCRTSCQQNSRAFANTERYFL